MNLSNTELYYADPSKQSGNTISVYGDEFSHITKVMRHKKDDEIYLTNGTGEIFFTRIDKVNPDHISTTVINSYRYPNKLGHIFFCIPKIKSADRFEFALEKCVELGITRFIIFESERTYKKGEKTERWQKILLSAMKQSLQSYLPTLECISSFDRLVHLPGEIIILEQNASDSLKSLKIILGSDYYFIFGPEGGLSQPELNIIGKASKYKLAENRLRSETAIVACAALISSL
jgi:16S rRNA (uracil1498-N3)-methyltransferase